MMALMVAPANFLDLLGKRVRYRGQVSVVVGRLDQRRSQRDRLAPFRDESVTVRFERPLGATFVEVEGAELAEIERLELARSPVASVVCNGECCDRLAHKGPLRCEERLAPVRRFTTGGASAKEGP